MADASRRTRFRWWICGLLFLATTINYMDRQVLGLVKEEYLFKQLKWNEIDYGNVVSCFSAAYAAGYLFAGRLMDLIGVRIGYGLSVILWSIAAMLHAPMRTVFGFGAARAALGLAEGGNFPAAIKTVSEWFPKKERALATGIFNAGANVGAIITPWVVAGVAWAWGYPAAFIVTGMLGFLWVLGWWTMYRPPADHPRVSPSELEHIRSDPPDPPGHVPWLQMLRYRQTWAFVVGMALSSPVWWFYLYWIPGYLGKQHGLNLLAAGLPITIIYLISDVGSIAGGWLSSWLIKRGWSINAGRKFTLLVCALCVVPVVFTSQTSNLWIATLLIGLAAAAHQGWSANLYTLVSDTMPRKAVSSVVGIGGMAGATVGIFFAQLIGHVLQWTGSYMVPFAIAAGAYLVALAVIQVLVPKLSPVEVA